MSGDGYFWYDLRCSQCYRCKIFIVSVPLLYIFAQNPLSGVIANLIKCSSSSHFNDLLMYDPEKGTLLAG